MDRKSFMAAGAAAGAGLVMPAIANASGQMHSKFAPTLRIRRDGLVVVARGPIGRDVNKHAYFAVVIQQGHRIGHGISELYVPGEPEWDAHVVVDHGRFRPGGAMAHGVAVMPDSNEVYTYNWSMHVQLVHH